MQVGSDGELLLELISDEGSAAAEIGVRSQRVHSAELQSDGVEAEHPGKVSSDEDAKGLLFRQTAVSQRVDGLDHKAREQFRTDARVLFAECELYTESLRQFLQQPSLAS